MPPGFAPPGGFDCDAKDLNDYLLDGSAKRDAGANFSQTYLIMHGTSLVGYFSVLTDAIRLKTKERPDGINYPTAPALKLGRLAVCNEHKRKGVATWALKYVVAMGRSISRGCGCRYITLDALQRADSLGLYEDFGFVRNEDEQWVRKIIRELKQRISQTEPLHNVSMRYDILLKAELPEAE